MIRRKKIKPNNTKSLEDNFRDLVVAIINSPSDVGNSLDEINETLDIKRKGKLARVKFHTQNEPRISASVISITCEDVDSKQLFTIELNVDAQSITIIPSVNSLVEYEQEDNEYKIIRYTEIDYISVLCNGYRDWRSVCIRGENDVIIESNKKVSIIGNSQNSSDVCGMVKIQELTDKLNKLTDDFNALVRAFNQHTHLVETKGTAVAQAGTAQAPVSKAQSTDSFKRDDYENENVIHAW